MNKNKGIVIWFVGLPCSGKTTLSRELEKYFKDMNLPVQRLDGDVVRASISKDLGFSKIDRKKNIERMSYISQMLSDNGVNVVSAFVSPYQEMRNFTRELCENFIEVYVKCSLQECKKRDVKGMYKKAESGEIKDFTGVQDPFEEPKNPEIIVNTDNEAIRQSIQKVIDYFNDFKIKTDY